MFMKASIVAVLLSPGLDWDDEETMPRYRQQLRELLRDLSNFLHRRNEDTNRYQVRDAGRLVYGLVVIAEKDPLLVEAALPEMLLEGSDLGMVDLTQEERLALERMQHACAAAHSTAPPHVPAPVPRVPNDANDRLETEYVCPLPGSPM